MSKDNITPENKTAQEPTEKSAPKSVKYIGPDYVKGIGIGKHLYDLKTYTREQAEALIARYPHTAKYFKLN